MGSNLVSVVGSDVRLPDFTIGAKLSLFATEHLALGALTDAQLDFDEATARKERYRALLLLEWALFHRGSLRANVGLDSLNQDALLHGVAYGGEYAHLISPSWLGFLGLGGRTDKAATELSLEAGSSYCLTTSLELGAFAKLGLRHAFNGGGLFLRWQP